MEFILSLNDLKRSDAKTLKEKLKEQHELIIQDRGTDAFILVDPDPGPL